MRKVNGEWHMGVDEARGESIHVLSFICPKCLAVCPLKDSRLKDGETIVDHDCPMKGEEGSHDGN